jgi:hypothetical protein
MKLHQAARSLGAQDLAVAREIVLVASLPVLGSGKTDYVRLADMAGAARPRAERADASRPLGQVVNDS